MYEFTVYDALPSDVTASSWCIYSFSNRAIISGNSMKTKLPIASLTKLMTLLLTLRYCKNNQLNLDLIKIKVSLAAATMQGTSAGLLQGEILSIKDLLYCLMLPSGNDAAHCLSESLGSMMYKVSKGIRNFSVFNQVKEGKPFDIQNEDTTTQACSVKVFVREMCSLANELGLKDTKFSNAHGLLDKNNFSSVEDIVILSQAVLDENQLCYQIASCKQHQINTNHRILILENTNKLLHNEGFKGLKTGFTQGAGGCLVSIYKENNKKMVANIDIMIVVIKSSSVDSRFTDTTCILEWYYRQLQHKIQERCQFYQRSLASIKN